MRATARANTPGLIAHLGWIVLPANRYWYSSIPFSTTTSRLTAFFVFFIPSLGNMVDTHTYTHTATGFVTQSRPVRSWGIAG
jgi:hypothetical protein